MKPFLSLCAVAAVMVFAAAPACARPNIIIIALDDVGFSDLGAFGSEIRTPHLDSIARNGLRFNHFSTKAICSSTRAALLTGRNNQTIGMGDLASTREVRDSTDTSTSRGEIPSNVEFIGEVLRKTGYSTFAVGKWHLSPNYETGESGNNRSWPLQRGFDRFYGFLSGWTNQYHPSLVEDNAKVPTPVSPNYHFAVDITDHAIADLKARDPAKPFFLYYASSIAHEPLQVPKSYIDSYDGVYDQGWDKVREARFARMKALGIIPADAKLPPRNPGDAAWDELGPVQRKVYARFMQAYAGFLEHGDAQIGRVLDYLHETGQDRNTLIVVISDNGAASEGMANGGFYKPYGDDTSVAEMAAHLEELGGEKTLPLYQRPWGMTGATPFRRYKLYPYLGGVRTPLMVSWPGIVGDMGAIRTQHVDVIDVAPTIAEAAGARFVGKIGQVAQIPVAGRSFLPSLRSAKAPSPRTVQFFELRGNRAIDVGGWRAVTMHKPGADFAQDDWKLFDLQKDFSESTDVAPLYPARLAMMKKAWFREAEKYGDLPLAEPPQTPIRRTLFQAEFGQ